MKSKHRIIKLCSCIRSTLQIKLLDMLNFARVRYIRLNSPFAVFIKRFQAFLFFELIVLLLQKLMVKVYLPSTNNRVSLHLRVNGGELFERVINDDFILTEKACVMFTRQICDGVAFMHSQNILHLDMKVS